MSPHPEALSRWAGAPERAKQPMPALWASDLGLGGPCSKSNKASLILSLETGNLGPRPYRQTLNHLLPCGHLPATEALIFYQRTP